MVTFSQPPQFKLDPRLARLLGLHTQSRSAIVQALWQYVKTNRLQDSHDKEYINGDKYFQQVPSPPSPAPRAAGGAAGRGSAPTKVTPPLPSRLRQKRSRSQRPGSQSRLCHGIALCGGPPILATPGEEDLEPREANSFGEHFLSLGIGIPEF